MAPRPHLKPKFHMVLIAAALALAAAPAIPARAAPITLDQAIARALTIAPALAAADAGQAAGAAQLLEARAPLFPSLSAGSEYYQPAGYSKAITNGGQSSGLLTLDYTALDFGRRAAQARAALYRAQAATLGVRAARAQVVFDATVAYFMLLRAQLVQRELVQSLARLTRYVTMVKSLRRTGIAVTADVLKIRAAKDNAELSLAAAKAATRQAAIALASLIGDPNPADLSAVGMEELASPPSGKIEQSPVFAAAERQVRAAALSVRAAQAERYPTVHLALSTGFLGINPPHTFNHNEGASYDGLISMPIFTGGLIKGHIDAARASEMAAKARLRQARLVLSQNYAEALARYHAARTQLAILTRAEPTADDSFALEWTGFLGGGGVTLLEVLAAYSQREQLRLARYDQQLLARQAAAQAALVLGIDQ